MLCIVELPDVFLLKQVMTDALERESISCYPDMHFFPNRTLAEVSSVFLRLSCPPFLGGNNSEAVHNFCRTDLDSTPYDVMDWHPSGVLFSCH